MRGQCVRFSALTECANDEEGCTLCYDYNGVMSDYEDSVMCADCDEMSMFDEDEGLGCVAIPFVDCEQGWNGYLCDECVIWDDENMALYDEGETVEMECYACNEEYVEYGWVVEIDTDHGLVCLDEEELFVDEEKSEDENEGCELWYW